MDIDCEFISFMPRPTRHASCNDFVVGSSIAVTQHSTTIYCQIYDQCASNVSEVGSIRIRLLQTIYGIDIFSWAIMFHGTLSPWPVCTPWVKNTHAMFFSKSKMCTVYNDMYNGTEFSLLTKKYIVHNVDNGWLLQLPLAVRGTVWYTSPSYCTPPVPGRDLLRRPIDSESTHSSAAASAAASVLQTFRHSKNCLKHLTSSYSARLLTTDTTCYQVTSHLRH